MESILLEAQLLAAIKASGMANRDRYFILHLTEVDGFGSYGVYSAGSTTACRNKGQWNGKPGQIFHFTPLKGKLNSKMHEVQGPGSEQEKDLKGRNLRDCDLW